MEQLKTFTDMLKNIIIGVLAFVTVFFVVYANIKATEAERQTLLAEMNLKLAKENEEKAKLEEQKAAEQAALATIEAQNARKLEQELENCK